MILKSITFSQEINDGASGGLFMYSLKYFNAYLYQVSVLESLGTQTRNCVEGGDCTTDLQKDSQPLLIAFCRVGRFESGDIS